MQKDTKKQEVILAEIDDFNLEIELTRQNKALMKLLEARVKQTKPFKTLMLRTSSVSINANHGEHRQDRRGHLSQRRERTSREVVSGSLAHLSRSYSGN